MISSRDLLDGPNRGSLILTVPEKFGLKLPTPSVSEKRDSKSVSSRRSVSQI